jgi:hypothetical protein
MKVKDAMHKGQRLSLCRQKFRFLARRPPTETLFECACDYCAHRLRSSGWHCSDANGQPAIGETAASLKALHQAVESFPKVS